MMKIFSLTSLKTKVQVGTFIVAGLLYSCGSEAPKEEKAEQESATKEEKVVLPSHIIDDIPSPTEMPVLLERSGVDFDQSLLNAADKTSDYLLTNDKAALNLGIYSTDLGYLCAYSKAQEAITYFKSSQQLVNKLGIAGSFEMSLMERFEGNISNKDSLLMIVKQSTSLAKEFLNESEQYNTSAMMVTGSFIEGLYIATGLVANYPEDLPEDVKNQVLVDLMRTILDQKKSLKDVIAILEPIEANDETAKMLLGDLRTLKGQYEKMNVEEKIKNNDGSFVLTDESLKEITTTVAKIRGEIVG